VAWGVAHWLVDAVPSALIACDLEVLVRNYVGAADGAEDAAALDIFQADVTATAVGDTAPGVPPGVAQLQRLFLGVCEHQFIVFFWNGRPCGVPVLSCFCV
jgi:hypothetical protein